MKNHLKKRVKQKIYKYTILRTCFFSIKYLFWGVFWLKKKKVPQEVLANIEWNSDYDIPLESFTKEKKKWISGIARLHNSSEFLKIVVESHLPLVDEVILINNNSTDTTADVCKKLVEQYGEKIKYYEYPFDHKPYSTKEHFETPENSLYSWIYYSNRCHAKANYSHICKLDDDHLMLNELCDLEDMRKRVLSSENKFHMYSGYNIIQQWNKYMRIASSWWYSWYMWDLGLYKFGQYTYFEKSTRFEVLRTNHLHKVRLWFAYIHLKYLKKDFIPSSWTFVSPSYKKESFDVFYDEKIDKLAHMYL